MSSIPQHKSNPQVNLRLGNKYLYVACENGQPVIRELDHLNGLFSCIHRIYDDNRGIRWHIAFSPECFTAETITAVKRYTARAEGDAE